MPDATPDNMDFQPDLDRLVALGAADHLLQIPVSDTGAEHAMLEKLTDVVPTPVIRLMHGVYAFTLSPDQAEATCTALAEFDGILSGLEPTGADHPTASEITALLDAARACQPPVLQAGLLLNLAPANHAPHPDMQALDDRLTRIEAGLDHLPEMSEQVNTLLQTIATPPWLETLLPAHGNDAGGTPAEADLLCELKAIAQQLQSATQTYQDGHNALQENLGALLDQTKTLDNRLSDTDHKAERRDLHRIIDRLASADTAPMHLIAEGQRLTRINTGLQTVLDHLTRDIAESPAADGESRQDLELQLTEALASLPHGQLRDLALAQTAPISRLLADAMAPSPADITTEAAPPLTEQLDAGVPTDGEDPFASKEAEPDSHFQETGDATDQTDHEDDPSHEATAINLGEDVPETTLYAEADPSDTQLGPEPEFCSATPEEPQADMSVNTETEMPVETAADSLETEPYTGPSPDALTVDEQGPICPHCQQPAAVQEPSAFAETTLPDRDPLVEPEGADQPEIDPGAKDTPVADCYDANAPDTQPKADAPINQEALWRQVGS
ncbi:hypothetical protein [Halovulum sp. GXIMD14793]